MIFLDHSFRCSFRVIYSQNLRRMKSWIVSKTSSETVVRSYWTMNDVKCHAMIWVNNKLSKKTRTFISLINKILNCLLMIDEIICKIRANYLIFKKFTTCTFCWIQCTNQFSYMRKYQCVKHRNNDFIDATKSLFS